MPSARKKIKTPPAKPGNSARLHIALAICALAALVVIGYFNSTSNGFVWDDHQQIVMNPTLQPTAPLTRIFSSDIRFAHQDSGVQTQTYRPLQMLTYRILVSTSGLSPTPFHLCNLLLAIACTLGAFAVFRLLTHSTPSAFAAAALFALYPIHTEAVDWIAASPDLGCTLFLLIAFALFLATRKTEPPRQPAWLLPLLSLASYAIALLWKETAAVFPILVLVYLLLAENSGLRAALTASAAYWAVLAFYIAIRISVLGELATGARDWALTPLQFLLNAAHLMLSYWLKLAWPFHLNAYYLFSPIHSISDPRAIAAILFMLAASAGLIYCARKAPLAAFAALWVCITLLPALDINAVGRNAFTERYLYLPSIGFCLLLTLAATRLINLAPTNARKPAAAALLILTLSAFAAATIQRNPDWKDDTTLFTQTLRTSPNAPFVRIMVAATQNEQSPGSAEAEQNYLQAISLAKQQTPPDRSDLVAAYKGLAALYTDRSDSDKALQMVASVRELAPADAEADTQEGLILARAGRWGEAEPLLYRTIALHPDNENLLSTLGLAAWQHDHNLNKAAEWFSKALAAHPDRDGFRASIHNNLGGVYGDQGDLTSSITQYKLALEIAPQEPEYHTNLANAYGLAKRYDEARAEAQAALQLDPTNPAAQAVLQNLK